MLKWSRNSRTTCSPSSCAQQAVVDEDAGQLIADRLVDQHRRDRGIDAAGKAADHPAPADLLADFLARLGAERGHGPVAPEAGDLVDEIGDQLRPVGGVGDLRVEHQAVERRFSSAISAKGAFSDIATRRKPGGSR